MIASTPGPIAPTSVLKGDLDDYEGRCQRQQVGGKQHPPHEPAAPHPPRGSLVRGRLLLVQQHGRLGHAGSRRRPERQGLSPFARAHNSESGDGGASTVVRDVFEVTRTRPLAAVATKSPSPLTTYYTSTLGQDWKTCKYPKGVI